MECVNKYGPCCSRCRTVIHYGGKMVCDVCAETISIIEKQIDCMDLIAGKCFANTAASYSDARIESLKQKAIEFLKEYLVAPLPEYEFYYYEYPMSNVHSMTFKKVSGIWCVIRQDAGVFYEKQYPEINDSNLGESFVALLIKENA